MALRMQSMWLIAAMFFVTHLSAQNGAVVWTEPAFPTQSDDVTVYFDATQGNGALAGFTGDVYAHTGVITNLSGGWRHVIGNWGTADSRVLMTREAPDLYSLSYNITDFYTPDAETVYELAFVFRNVNGSIVGRASDGSDIFTPVYPENQSLLALLRSPGDDDVIYSEEDSVLIDLILSDTVLVNIYDNDILFFSQSTSHVQFSHHPSGPGEHLLRFEIIGDTTIILEKYYFVLDPNPVIVNPPAETRSGLNYFTDSTYVFRLHAPLKQHVFLLCPANGYRVDEDFQLNLGEDGSTFWIELPKSLFVNGNATYQYLVDGNIKIADPHAEVVLDPWNDSGVASQVLATLSDYPAGMTTGIVTAFDEEDSDFAFSDFEKPAKEKLVIYELLMRDFLANHSFTSLLDTLDYFQKLGVNAIELMPVNEFEGNNSWGYNPSFHMAVDKYYGTREQLKAVIEAAHERGIAVILDVVFNHTFGQGPWAQLYWDPLNSRPAANSPYLNPIARHPFNVGYDFNHESQATKNWVKRVLSHWIEEFHFDGFRFDLSKGLTQFNSGNDVGLMGQYDASRIAILKDYADHIWSIDPDSYVIMEHFADNSEEIELSNYGMMLWGNANFQFAQAAKGVQSDLEGIDYTQRGWSNPHLIGYMESHDEERQQYRVLTEGDSEGTYNTRQLTTALQRGEATAALFYSVPGPKMLWEFGELGYAFPINYCVNGTISDNCRLDPKPIHWEYLEDYRREHLRKVTSAVMHLHTTHPTFATEDFEFNDGNLFLKTVHLHHPDMEAVVLVNYRVINSNINPKFPFNGTWYEYFSGDSLEVVNTTTPITFGPGEYRIYTSDRLVPPGGFITATRDLPVSNIEMYPSLIRGDAWASSILSATEIKDCYLTGIAGERLDARYESDGSGGVIVHIPGSLPNGLYMVHVVSDDQLFVGKVMKME